ncbi:MAG: FAD-dependent oxidoreductase, partial [Oscillospiraceae bacterium]|nr:FAD-dependent oxidoreductase [Oscillospiraceae bacterium]
LIINWRNVPGAFVLIFQGAFAPSSIGGGVAGVTAMTTLVERGHDVTLYEKTNEFGGHVVGAAAPPFKIDCQDYLKWLRLQADKCPARKIMNTEVTKEMLDAENYDAVVIAVGSEPFIPNLPGIDKPHVHWAPDAETGKCEVGNKIVVVGAGAVGLEAAIHYLDDGKEVTVIEMLDAKGAAKKLHESSATVATEFFKIIDERKMPVYYGTGLSEIKDNSIVCKDVATGELKEFECDTVLLAMGMRARKDKVAELRHCAPETSVFVVGDAKKARTIGEAVNEAFQACIHI